LGRSSGVRPTLKQAPPSSHFRHLTLQLLGKAGYMTVEQHAESTGTHTQSYVSTVGFFQVSTPTGWLSTEKHGICALAREAVKL
jgi:hypothetical protein